MASYLNEIEYYWGSTVGKLEMQISLIACFGLQEESCITQGPPQHTTE